MNRYVTEGTSPEGSMWALNPVPRTWKSLSTGEWAGNYAQTGEGFQPFCPNDEGDYSCVGMWGPYNMEIVDMVKIPDDLPAGEYVLGWRWDCEYVVGGWQPFCRRRRFLAAALAAVDAFWRRRLQRWLRRRQWERRPRVGFF
jgi:hypothetical protein